ncbi:MAG TPA: amidohydrolase family protein [Victivallales bacterium]|nr:amidohydrolase family protein [Victivallales bacterium]
MKTLLTNANIFDGKNNKLQRNMNVLIEDNLIKQIFECSKLYDKKVDQTINLNGKFLMPGLIDAHAHLSMAELDINQDKLPESYIWVNAGIELTKILKRGFTTVRDAGGADFGLKMAVEKGLLQGPRLFLSCKALTQTHGHGDLRNISEKEHMDSICRRSGSTIAIICDGISGVRKAAREQLRKGATQIKIMASGGVASQTDKIDNLQFSIEEIEAVVEEANNAGTYVMAHAYSPKAITRCVQLGVRSVEHGNLIDNSSAEIVKQYKAYVIPTLSIYDSLYRRGSKLGFPEKNIEKLNQVIKQSIKGLAICRNHELNIGFGTDLLGELQNDQCNEFELRSKAETPFQTLNSATYVNAKLLQMENKLGIIKKDAFADLIVVSGNPLKNISLFTENGKNILMIIKDGKIIKNEL